ncbi:MAG: hypothetical protein D6773_06430, partial [Alphaproteobacteria bacterium]
HKRLDALAAQAGAARDQNPGSAGDMLDKVEHQAAELARQVREADQKRRAQQAEASLRALEARLDVRGDGPPEPAAQPEPGAQPVPRQDAAQPEVSEQFARITAGFEQTLAAGHPSDSLETVKNELSSLSQRLEQVLAEKTDGAALRAIEAQLTQLTAQFAQAQQHYARVESMEQNIAQILNALKSNEASIDTAARRAAQETVQAMGALPEALGDRLDALQRDLNALNERSREVNGRTVGTLESMNATLLSLTSQIAAAPPAAPLPAAGPAVPPEEKAAPSAAGDRPPHAETAAPAETAGMGAGQPSPNTVGSTIPDFQEPPLAAASREPDAGAAQGSAERQNIVVEDDFLASARRAAAAASARKTGAESGKTGFLAKLRGRPAAESVAAGTPSKGPRPVLVLAALLLLGSGAAFLYGRLKGGGHE